MPSSFRRCLPGWLTQVREAQQDNVKIRIRGRKAEPNVMRQRSIPIAEQSGDALLRRLTFISADGPVKLAHWYERIRKWMQDEGADMDWFGPPLPMRDDERAPVPARLPLAVCDALPGGRPAVSFSVPPGIPSAPPAADVLAPPANVPALPSAPPADVPGGESPAVAEGRREPPADVPGGESTAIAEGRRESPADVPRGESPSAPPDDSPASSFVMPPCSFCLEPQCSFCRARCEASSSQEESDTELPQDIERAAQPRRRNDNAQTGSSRWQGGIEIRISTTGYKSFALTPIGQHSMTAQDVMFKAPQDVSSEELACMMSQSGVKVDVLVNCLGFDETRPKRQQLHGHLGFCDGMLQWVLEDREMILMVFRIVAEQIVKRRSIRAEEEFCIECICRTGKQRSVAVAFLLEHVLRNEGIVRDVEHRTEWWWRAVPCVVRNQMRFECEDCFGPHTVETHRLLKEADELWAMAMGVFQ